MNIEICNQLKDKLFKKYADFNKENVFVHVELSSPHDAFTVIDYNYLGSPRISVKKLGMIARFSRDFLWTKKQSGYLYVGEFNIKI